MQNDHRRRDQRYDRPRRQDRPKDDDRQGPSSSDTLVHFHKSFGVMQELFEHVHFTTLREDLLRAKHRSVEPHGAVSFLDLGCAPGGFSAYLTQPNLLSQEVMGYGVTLPRELGGFDMAFASEKVFVQFMDLMELEARKLMCPDNAVEMVVADAQYLSVLYQQMGLTSKYRGVKVKLKNLGIWCLTVKQCLIAFQKLKQHGVFMFRFGWRGTGMCGAADEHPTGEKVAPDLLAKYEQEEEWYKALTYWLFSVLKSLFKNLKPFKSEYYHQADVSFYMVCTDFDRGKFVERGWIDKLKVTVEELSECDDVEHLIASVCYNDLSDEAKTDIDSMLDYVGRIRAIGIESKKRAQQAWEKKQREKEQYELQQRKLAREQRANNLENANAQGNNQGNDTEGLPDRNGEQAASSTVGKPKWHQNSKASNDDSRGHYSNVHQDTNGHMARNGHMGRNETNRKGKGGKSNSRGDYRGKGGGKTVPPPPPLDMPPQDGWEPFNWGQGDVSTFPMSENSQDAFGSTISAFSPDDPYFQGFPGGHQVVEGVGVKTLEEELRRRQMHIENFQNQLSHLSQQPSLLYASNQDMFPQGWQNWHYDSLMSNGPWQPEPPVVHPADHITSQLSSMDVAPSAQVPPPLAPPSAGLPSLEQVLSQVPRPLPQKDDDGISILPSSLRPRVEQKSGGDHGEDSDANSDGSDKGARKWKHSKRSGRSVRDKRTRVQYSNMPKQNFSRSRAMARKLLGRLYFVRDGDGWWLFLHICRFGLFFTMAWSLSRISFSLMRVVKDELLSR